MIRDLSHDSLFYADSTITVGNSPSDIEYYSVNRGIFVTNRQDDVVSVLDDALSPSNCS